MTPALVFLGVVAVILLLAVFAAGAVVMAVTKQPRNFEDQI